jgi:hypothetical protein
MLPVASFQRRDFQLRRPPRLPLISAPVAVDTGAFAWFQSHTMYHFSASQLCDWIYGVRPRIQWAVIPDRPTEDLDRPSEVLQAQQDTTESIVHVLGSFIDLPWSWIPVLQGRTLDDYFRHAIELADVLYSLADVYARRGQPFRVGLGSICRRGQVTEIRRIVSGVADILPGLPPSPLRRQTRRPHRLGEPSQHRRSCDSAAWNGRFGSAIPFIEAERRHLGLSERQYSLKVALPRYARRVEALFDQQLLPFP